MFYFILFLRQAMYKKGTGKTSRLYSSRVFSQKMIGFLYIFSYKNNYCLELFPGVSWGNIVKKGRLCQLLKQKLLFYASC